MFVLLDDMEGLSVAEIPPAEFEADDDDDEEEGGEASGSESDDPYADENEEDNEGRGPSPSAKRRRLERATGSRVSRRQQREQEELVRLQYYSDVSVGGWVGVSRWVGGGGGKKG